MVAVTQLPFDGFGHEVVAECFFESARLVPAKRLRPLQVADIAIGRVPMIRRTQRRQRADDRADDFYHLALMIMADAPFRVAHLMPDVAHFARHQIRQHLQFIPALAVRVANQVRAVANIFARRRTVFDGDVLGIPKPRAQPFAEVKAGEVIVVARTNDDANRRDTKRFFHRLRRERAAEAIGLGKSPVAILRGAGGGLAGFVVGVELVVAEYDDDFFRALRRAGEQRIRRGAILSGSNLGIVILPAGFRRLREFAEVNIGNAEFVKEFAVLTFRHGEFQRRVGGRQAFELLRVRLGQRRHFAPQPHFNLIICVGGILLRAGPMPAQGHFPRIDDVPFHFPLGQIHFAVFQRGRERGDVRRARGQDTRIAG